MIDPDKYFGDGFEAFVESLIAQQGLTKKIMIRDYTPVLEDDLGVDGYGYGPDGEIHHGSGESARQHRVSVDRQQGSYL